MSRTVIGLFDEFKQAEGAVRALEAIGVTQDHISIVANNANDEYTNWRDTEGANYGTPPAGQGANIGATAGGISGILLGLGLLAIPGLGPLAAAGPLVAGLTGAGVGAATGAVAGGLIGGLTSMGVPEEHAGYFAEGIRRGGTLVTVSAPDNLTDQVIDILNSHGAVDINQRASYYQETGYTGYNASAQPYTASELAAERTRVRTATVAAAPAMMETTTKTAVQTPNVTIPPVNTTATQNTAAMPRATNAAGEQTLNVVEESLEVGKRQVQSGGVRVYTRVTEKPVEASVNLREEHVTIERHAVNRPASEADFAAFKEGTIEVTETAEVAVVAKEARIVEEVSVGKVATERTETIHDTVRRTDVEVEQIEGQTTTTGTTMGTTGTNTTGYTAGHTARDIAANAEGAMTRTEGSIPGVQTGGHAVDGSGAPDTRGITEKIADTLTGNRVDDKTGKPV